MQKKNYFLLILIFSGLPASAQRDSSEQRFHSAKHGSSAGHDSSSRVRQWLDLSFAFGRREGTGSISFVRNWGIGKSRKLELGLGLRMTNYIGDNKEFYTAPGRYARSTTFPFAIVFADHVESNIDTLTVQRPRTSALNLTLNAGYRITPKLYAGLNIDLTGFTVGRKSAGILHSNGSPAAEPVAKPTTFNLLLTGDNDLGSLNSEFFIRYTVAARFDVKAVYQFAFSEYKTQSVHQVTPDGGEVYRFRNKANLFGVGVAYFL